jgi:TPR repeat protein
MRKNIRPERVAGMKKLVIAVGLIAAAQMMGASGALAGPLEDGMASYNRGDYQPAMALLRQLAQQGNARAQGLIGVMYRRGHGVAQSAVHAFMWLSLAAARGDAAARTELNEMALTMSAAEQAKAREMTRVCEASGYRNCEH